MKFVAAYLLAHLGGNPSPTRDDVRGILDSVGAEVEEHRLELFFREVDGKDAAELITAGREKLAYFPCGGAAVEAAPAAAAAAAAEEKKKAEEKAEEKVEDEEEDDLNMLSLFD